MSNPTEVEIRIILKNKREIEKSVKKLGAKKEFSLNIIDSWYCPEYIKNYKNAEIDKIGFGLRIRESKDLKLNKDISTIGCKTLYDGRDHTFCREYETSLGNVNQMKEILESVGFKKFLTIKKRRIVYKYKNMNLCFDKINDIGYGLEIEIITTSDTKTTQKKLKDFAFRLGIKPREILQKSLTFVAMKKLSKF